MRRFEAAPPETSPGGASVRGGPVSLPALPKQRPARPVGLAVQLRLQARNVGSGLPGRGRHRGAARSETGTLGDENLLTGTL